MSSKISRGGALLLVVLLWAICYLPNLGAPELKGEEGRRILPAITMLDTGQWVLPYIGGEPYHNKPPLINWLVAASFELTGSRSEWSARLPSVLFMLAPAVMLVLMRGDWLPLRARLVGAMVFLTAGGLLEKGRLIEMEAVYVSLTAVASIWWLEGWVRANRPWRLWLGAAVPLAAGLMLKGPIILVFFVSLAACVVVIDRRSPAMAGQGRRHIAAGLSALALTLAPLAVWAWLAQRHASADAMAGEWQHQMGQRLSPETIDWAEWGMAIVNSLKNFLPWLPFLTLLWRRSVLDRIPSQRRALFRACRLAVVLGFAIPNLMPGTLARYSLPIFPLAAIMVGWSLGAYVLHRWEQIVWRTGIVMGLFAAMFAAVGMLLWGRLGAATWYVQGAGAALATAVLATVVVKQWPRLSESLPLAGWTATAMAAGMLVYGTAGVPVLLRHTKYRPAGKTINALVPPTRTVFLYRPNYEPFVFYIDRPVDYLLRPEDVSDKVEYVVARPGALGRLFENGVFGTREPHVLADLTDTLDEAYLLARLEEKRPTTMPDKEAVGEPFVTGP